MRPSEDKVRRLIALGQLHDQFVEDNLERSPFRPQGRPEGSDYNQHHVDLEAPADAQARFHRRAMEILHR